MLYRQKDKSLPSEDNTEDLANKFVTFFADKVKRITDNFTETEMPDEECPQDIILLNRFYDTSEKELKEIILTGNSKCCILDPLPTSLVKECLDILLPVLLRIVNLSLSSNVLREDKARAGEYGGGAVRDGD